MDQRALRHFQIEHRKNRAGTQLFQGAPARKLADFRTEADRPRLTRKRPRKARVLPSFAPRPAARTRRASRNPMPSTPESPPPDPRPGEPPARSATLPEIVRAVLWSFFGVRKGQAMQRDVVTIKPHQVIVVGILIAAAVVAILLILVRFITRGL